MSVEATLAQLVAIDSTSSKPNGAIVEFALARVVAAGLRARVTSYRDERNVEKFQMLAFAPVETDEVELALVGHTDTVPFEASWSQALALEEHEGRLYGRGACDTKGFIAAAITAIEETDVRNLRRPLAPSMNRRSIAGVSHSICTSSPRHSRRRRG